MLCPSGGQDLSSRQSNRRNLGSQGKMTRQDSGEVGLEPSVEATTEAETQWTQKTDYI